MVRSHLEQEEFVSNVSTEISFRQEMALGNDSEFAQNGSATVATAPSARAASSKQPRPVNALLHKTCLHPKLSLRNQLLLSFGIVSTLSVFFVTITAITVSKEAGDHVKTLSRANLREWGRKKVQLSSRIVAQTTSQTIDQLEGLANILLETTLDRFEGYTGEFDENDDDSFVPFTDMASGERIYPLRAETLLPLDWQVESTITESVEEEEHFGQRRHWYGEVVSTATPVFWMQGACDPSVTSEDSPKTYFPNCSAQNNDISVGGKIAPTPTLEEIHRKASDYLPAILKPLYEMHELGKSLGVMFANAGAGASVVYPAEHADANSNYTSIGCDWMRALNPLNASRGPIGTEEEIAKCHANGTIVSSREYNPLERNWCRMQALHPTQFQSYGPDKDAWTPNLWLMTYGRSIYDRRTQKLIACTLADVSVVPLAEMINSFQITKDTTSVALVRWDGIVVASERWDPSTAKEPINIGDIDIGISNELYETMKTRFEMTYHHEKGSDNYDPVFVSSDGALFASQPIPDPPKEYDSNYSPQFMVIIALGAATFSELDLLDEAVNQDVNDLITTILVAGVSGIVAVLICIYVMSLYITRPMEWMEKVGGNILDSFGASSKDIDYETTALLRFSPRSEITLLVQEFQDFVKRFSGQGTAKLHIRRGVEIQNPFALEDNFKSLYENRDTQFFRYNEEIIKSGSMNFQELDFEDIDTAAPPGENNRFHRGPNIREAGESAAAAADGSSLDPLATNKSNNKLSVLNSRLFWLILGFNAVPLLVTMIAISAHVTSSISHELPRLVNTVEEVFIGFEQNSLMPLATSRATFASLALSTASRDLHLLTRITEWLLFDGLKRSPSVTSITSAAEECKAYSPRDIRFCPYFDNEMNELCDCKWNHMPSAITPACADYNFDVREHQQVWWVASSLDNWPNGHVNFTSYPEMANSSETTSWWDDWSSVPGFESGISAPGHDSTYKQLLTVAALSMIQIPLYNYQETNRGIGALATFTAFDDNGLFSGYTGCEPSHAIASQFVSDEANEAGHLVPGLCPLGKHGYDPRCRKWYIGAKIKHKSEEEGVAPMYVTSPLIFPGTETVGQTAVMPLIDPRTDQYVGQTLVDIDNRPILESLTSKETPLNGQGFTVLISTTDDVFGRDVVVGPGFTLEDIKDGDGDEHPIEDLVMPHDICHNGEGAGCENRQEFDLILEAMRKGESGFTSFNRTTESGQTELIYWAYAPVVVKSLKSVNSSDYSQGAKPFTSNIFSMALAQTQLGLYEEFESIEEQLDQTVNTAVGVLLTLMIIACCGVTYISTRATSSIIKPVSQLLQLVTMIKSGDSDDSNSQIQGGSREVTRVHDTFERLSKVVPFANSAFFSGDLSKAYATLTDALELFTKLENPKAIGVANNNLGNTMLAIYRTMKKTQVGFAFGGMDKRAVIAKGISYFEKAISAGEEALADINKVEGWSTNYLVFMQQLANRYFNRAVFLLTVKEDHPDPDEAERRGKTDLSTAKDMDREVVDNGDQQGFKGGSDVYFELLLARIKGIVNLLELGYEDEWDIKELFEEITKNLYEALEIPEHVLFRHMLPAGQMQRLDTVLIEYYRQSNDTEKAAQVAIRMLVEDEYILAQAGCSAVKALIDFVPNAKNLGGVDPSDLRTTLFQYRQRITEANSLVSQAKPGGDGSDFMMRESAKQSNIGDVSQESF